MPLIRKPGDPKPVQPPKDVEERVRRGRERMKDGAAVRNECIQFWRGDQYVYRNRDGYLVKQGTVQGEKPSHRVRTTRNLILDVVRTEVSNATSRVPSYDVMPATNEPEDRAAAAISEKVALFGYDAWRVRRATVDTVTYAVVADEGFAWPYFDPTIGRPISGGVHEGDIRIRVFGPNEVFWEPGVRFEDSRWYAVEQARPIDEVKSLPTFVGGELEPDAEAQQTLNAGVKSGGKGQLVLVCEYLERPCRKYPKGRRVVMANGRVICEPEAYPFVDAKGAPVDEPVLHKLSYISDPDSDRDMGLVRHLLDAQRTYNDCNNKQIEWKNLALNPQLILRNMVLKQRLTDEPGAVYTALGSGDITWRPVPAIPPELSRMKDDAQADIGRIASQNAIPSQVEAGRAIQALIERDATARQSFIANLAEWHSRLMRHCLTLVQRHYTEPRQIQIVGRFGPDRIEDFRGADLRGQIDVRVFPASIEPRTKEAIKVQVLAFADRGWISPQAAMAAINGGMGEKLIDSYELDAARANRIIQKIKAGPDVLFSAPDQPDGTPGWMPRRFDNIPVQKSIFEDWMKTVEYEDAPAEVQEAANLYYQGLLSLEAEKMAEEAAAQQQMAEGLGMQNAAKPQAPKPLPSPPSGQAPPPGEAAA